MKYALMLFAIALSGCTVKETVSHDGGNNGALALTANAISVSPATALECANGGSVYSVFIDKNSNGVLDTEEAVVNSQTVCNGADGASGLSTFFSMSRVATGLDACESESGLQINSGLDQNSNGALDASEIIGTQILCDGAKGETGASGAAGAAGVAGSNGYNMVFQSTAAGAEQCAAGGSTIVMALDTNRNGSFDLDDSNPQSMTLCNGVDGADGTDGHDGANGADAVLPSYSPVEPITPCGNSTPYKEVLLRLANGQVLSSFSDNTAGSMTRLTLLPDGTYLDTDNSSCKFTLSTSPDKTTRSISWGGHVQGSWPLSN